MVQRTLQLLLAAVVLVATACAGSTTVIAQQPPVATVAPSPTPVPTAAPVSTVAATPTVDASPTAAPVSTVAATPTVDASPTTAAVPPDETAPREQADAAGLPSWDEMIGDKRYTDVATLIDSGDFDPDGAGVTIDRLSTVALGDVIDGVYLSEYPPGALTWRTRMDIDTASKQYAYLGSDVIAEPGDGGCFEQLEIGGESFERGISIGGTQDATALNFVLNPELDSAFDSDEGSIVDFMIETAHSFDMLNAEPQTTALDGGFMRLFAILGEADAQIGAEAFVDEGSTNNDYQVGALEIIVDTRGHARAATFWARYLADEREFSTGAIAQRSRTVYSHATFGPFAPDVLRTTDMSLLTSGYCRPPTTGIVGEWPLRSVIGGGSEMPAPALEQMQAAFIAIGADGTLSGTTGCRTFQGAADIGFASLDNVSIVFEGEPCAEDSGFDERVFEDIFVTVLSQDVAAVITLEGRLFLGGLADGTQVLLHFRQD